MAAFLKTLGILVLGLALSFVLGPIFTSWMSPYVLSIAMYAGINVTLAVSLNLVNGLTGQFSMGHAGFMAVGGYASAFMTTVLFNDLQFAFLSPEISNMVVFALSLYVGGLVASLFGYILGLPSLRLKGDYLAIVTLGFGEIVRVLILNIDAIGAARGLPGIPQYTHLGWVFAVAFFCVLFVRRLMQAPTGRSLLAVREDEIAAEACGVNTTSAKIRAFVIGAFFAGVAGGLFAHYLTYLNPQTFDFNRSFEIIIMVVLGGMGSTTGAVVAAVFLTFLREALRPLQEITKQDYRMVIYSVMLIILMLTRPKGFFGTRELSDFGFFKWFKHKGLRPKKACSENSSGVKS
jgi:branched-chain amino acid transport system permease protein